MPKRKIKKGKPKPKPAAPVEESDNDGEPSGQIPKAKNKLDGESSEDEDFKRALEMSKTGTFVRCGILTAWSTHE